MLKRMLISAAAGAAAAVPQSAAVWGLRYAGVYRRRPAPEVVVEQITDKVVDLDAVPDPWLTPMKVAGHFGFGAACGAVYGALSSVLRPNPVTGVLTGLAIWKGSYDGWIPALGIMPPPADDETGRQATLVIAHIAYGLALGALMQRLTARG